MYSRPTLYIEPSSGIPSTTRADAIQAWETLPNSIFRVLYHTPSHAPAPTTVTPAEVRLNGPWCIIYLKYGQPNENPPRWLNVHPPIKAAPYYQPTKEEYQATLADEFYEEWKLSLLEDFGE